MNYQNGVMPTNEWFEKIKNHLDFKGKTVVDYGCAEGMMCILSKQAGASRIIGIDNQGNFYPHKYIDFRKEDIGKKYDSDIKIFSMIIHWIGKEEFLKQIDSQEAVVIFREKNEGYNHPANGVWFPTLDELSDTLKGFKLKHDEVLMEQDNHKRIILAIYEKNI